jgi:hypothetical protein
MTLRFTKKVLHFAHLAGSTLQSVGKSKVFCIGKNKTGTTSIAKAFTKLGLVVGDQTLAGRLLSDWACRDFRRLFLYCYTAQAFQDIPFSLPFTFQALDQHFPSSKFILTVRDTPEQWYSSLINFYAAIFSHGNFPTLDDLRAATFIHPGWMYEAHRLINNTPADDPFNKETVIANYNAHNAAVLAYFRHRPQDLLVLNVATPSAYDQLCHFLAKPCTGKEFPWENKTADITGAG